MDLLNDKIPTREISNVRKHTFKIRKSPQIILFSAPVSKFSSCKKVKTAVSKKHNKKHLSIREKQIIFDTDFLVVPSYALNPIQAPIMVKIPQIALIINIIDQFGMKLTPSM